jgi:hypothetical protein
MKITDVPFAVMRIQYEIARLPLGLVAERVFSRMDSEAPARLCVERSLGMLDMTAGTALRNPELKDRGAALIERSDQLRRAARLDAAATENIKQAGASVRATREQAVQQREDARAEKASAAKQARQEAQNRKRAAVEETEKRVAAGKKRADADAAQRQGAVEAAKREEDSIIDAAEQSAVAAADAKLEDARDVHAEAVDKRAKADRIEELADAEKEQRQ